MLIQISQTSSIGLNFIFKLDPIVHYERTDLITLLNIAEHHNTSNIKEMDKIHHNVLRRFLTYWVDSDFHGIVSKGLPYSVDLYTYNELRTVQIIGIKEMPKNGILLDITDIKFVRIMECFYRALEIDAAIKAKPYSKNRDWFYKMQNKLCGIRLRLLLRDINDRDINRAKNLPM